MSPHRFAFHRIYSLVWFQTFIQKYKIPSNQKEGINNLLKAILNDLCLHAEFLDGLFVGQSSCFLYYRHIYLLPPIHMT